MGEAARRVLRLLREPAGALPLDLGAAPPRRNSGGGGGRRQQTSSAAPLVARLGISWLGGEIGWLAGPRGGGGGMVEEIPLACGAM